MFLVVGFGSPAQAFSSVELIFVRYGPHDVSPIAHINFPDDSTLNTLPSSAAGLPA